MLETCSVGDKVKWDLGDGAAEGEIEAVHTQNVTKTIEGEDVSREADPGRPAFTIRRHDGGVVLLARHEVTPVETKEHRPTTRQGQLETPEYLGEPGAPSQGGVAGGDLQEKVGKRDEEKRAEERPGGATRVEKKDENNPGHIKSV